MKQNRDNVVGVDVGMKSVGLATVAHDEKAIPVEILNALSALHDGGTDKTGNPSRKALRGIHRRERNRNKKMKRRLSELDTYLLHIGWPIEDLQETTYAAWRVRGELVEDYISNDSQRAAKLSIAVRHIARHRGFRNTWKSVNILQSPTSPSSEFKKMVEKAKQDYGAKANENMTLSQVVLSTGLSPEVNLRRDFDPKLKSSQDAPLGRKKFEPLLSSFRLEATDNANELHVIFEKQNIDETIRRDLIRLIFEVDPPGKAAASLAGTDPIEGRTHLQRAPIASIAFQHFRIAAALANTRVVNENESIRVLTVKERQTAFNFLSTDDDPERPSWEMLIDKLGFEKCRLEGAAALDDEGIRYQDPPISITHQRILSINNKTLQSWWKSASDSLKDEFVNQVVTFEPYGEIGELLAQVSDEGLDLFDLKLPSGRAPYSLETLRDLTEHMLNNESDLFEARTEIFELEPDWIPPAPPIHEPTGNLAVDRVLSIVHRYLTNIDTKYGIPSRIVIEYARSASKADETVQEEQKLRRNINRKFDKDVMTIREQEGPVSESERRRIRTFQRQGGICLYCGTPLSWSGMELDHIVPRNQFGVGADNRESNLAAVCRPCNKRKGNRTFADWISTEPNADERRKQTFERVEAFDGVTKIYRKDKNFIAQMKQRLRLKSQSVDFDKRRLESVAWMATELRRRIKRHYLDTHQIDVEVDVFPGGVTSEARKAAGLEKDISFIKPVGSQRKGKSRLDRRHHAIDAIVLTQLTPNVAQTLVERMNIDRYARDEGLPREEWTRHEGRDQAAKILYQKWKTRMKILLPLINDALQNDTIPVTRQLRLRLPNGEVHSPNPGSLAGESRRVGDTLTQLEIDRSSTPALWCALTSHPDYDPKTGLPADSSRQIRVNGTQLGANDEISFFKAGSKGRFKAEMVVRGGSVGLGTNIHHARIYRIHSASGNIYAMVRVFGWDLRRHRKENLFQANLPLHSISLRTSPKTLRRAIEQGEAEYVGWLVQGDEILLDPNSDFGALGLKQFFEYFPNTLRWSISGFEDSSLINLRPTYLSAEGLEYHFGKEIPQIVNDIIKIRSWRSNVDKLFQNGNPQILRRDTLGRARPEKSEYGPSSWSLRGEQ